MNIKRIFSVVSVASLIPALYILILLRSHGKKIPNLMNTHLSHESVRFGNYSDKKDGAHFENLCDSYSDGVNIHNYHKLQDHMCKSLASSCQIHSCSAAIDIVVLWINMDDQNIKVLYDSTYQSTKHSRSYSSHSVSPSRFRDFHQLKYFLRSIEENGAGWARRIFLVTNNQVPQYVNISHPRIRVVNHEQLFNYMKLTPPKYPLFNSLAIQSMLHSIPTLSSPFYLFDDDMFIRKNLSVSMIVNGNKSIVDLDNAMYDIHLRPKTDYDARMHSTIRMGLKKRSLDLLRDNNRYMIGFHGPLLLYREIGTKIWDEFREEMNLVISHPFRKTTDPSIQTLYMYVGYSDYYTFVKDRGILQFEMLGSSSPTIIERKLQQAFMNKAVYFVCVNDDLLSFNEQMETCIKDAYEVIFPKASSFEIKSGIKNNITRSRLKSLPMSLKSLENRRFSLDLYRKSQFFKENVRRSSRS